MVVISLADGKPEGGGCAGLSRHPTERGSDDGARYGVHVQCGACARDWGRASNPESESESSDICAFLVEVWWALTVLIVPLTVAGLEMLFD